MRINEDCINHNVALLVDEWTASLYELEGKEMALAMGEIRGALDLAERLKEVLRS